jgi:2-polyprenyl-3-methyl-5-hydroxy-6-metoxy-1,4-benzoquinol methylase
MDYTVTAQNIFTPSSPVAHRGSEYREDGFEVLLKMQRDHFWYRGRSRFILRALNKFCQKDNASAIDLGGGCGGWVQYLAERSERRFSELAMGDSCLPALVEARKFLDPNIALYHCDILNLGWKDSWDVVFLLDVIEHIPDDAEVLKAVSEIVRPGGLVFVTTPALNFFWSYNDDVGHHLRRYNKSDMKNLATNAGLELVDARYFMFLLSPLYLLARSRRVMHLSEEEKLQLIIKQHQIPPAIVNSILSWVFGLERSLGYSLPFPWGTSILGVFRKR